MRVRLAAAALAMVLASGVAAAAARQRGAQPIYAAFSVVPEKRPATKRCGPYTVTTGTYSGVATSPDPRLAGSATIQARLVVQRLTGQGFATGTLRIRDRRRVLRAEATLKGVITEGSVLNGLVSGKIFVPSALLLANVTIVFNEDFTFGAVRLGVESGKNSGIAYSALGRC